MEHSQFWIYFRSSFLNYLNQIEFRTVISLEEIQPLDLNFFLLLLLIEILGMKFDEINISFSYLIFRRLRRWFNKVKNMNIISVPFKKIVKMFFGNLIKRVLFCVDNYFRFGGNFDFFMTPKKRNAAPIK